MDALLHKRVEGFFTDLSLLQVPPEIVADRLNLSVAQLQSVLSAPESVTSAFLHDFYYQFGEQIVQLKIALMDQLAADCPLPLSTSPVDWLSLADRATSTPPETSGGPGQALPPVSNTES